MPAEVIPQEQTRIYRRVLSESRARGIPFALGGAFAVGTYTGNWRNTKDLDLCILLRDRERMVELLSDAGLSDYYAVQPYDRAWIYRSHEGENIVDVIWAMANQRVAFDEAWLTRGPQTEFLGEFVRVVPAEELIWDKLYIMQRQRCDWPDVLNLIHSTARQLDWEHLLKRLDGDEPLLTGVLAVYRWLCPGDSNAIPQRVWERLQLPLPSGRQTPGTVAARARLIDTRPWFNGNRS